MRKRPCLSWGACFSMTRLVHLKFFLVACLLVTGLLCAIIYFAHLEMRRARAAWPSAAVQILAERTIVAQVYSEHRDNAIFYQGEVRGRYMVNGRSVEAWIPALSASADREALDRDLQQMTRKHCYVRWNPDYAEEVNLIC